MRNKSQRHKGDVDNPESWGAALGLVLLGALSGFLGSGVLIPFDYYRIGTGLLIFGTLVMIFSSGAIIAVFFRLWRPPGITEAEW